MLGLDLLAEKGNTVSAGKADIFSPTGIVCCCLGLAQVFFWSRSVIKEVSLAEDGSGFRRAEDGARPPPNTW